MLFRSPSSEFVKINFGGTVFAKDNKSGVGMVIRNDGGLVIASCAKKLLAAYSGGEIETMATAIALSFASEIGIKRAIQEGDSLAMIKALREDVSSLSPTGLLVEDVKALSHNFDKLLYSHTKREGNQVVHSLVRYAIDIPYFLVWMEHVPPQIHSVLQADLIHLH